MPDMEEIAAALKRHGAARHRARAKVREESEQIAALAARGFAAGMTKSHIARLAQVSRPALDAMLNQHEQSSP